jgi:biopolymer transport protein ExbD
MAYKPKAGATMAAPNVIPMADIMLVLLIIFMVVTPMLSRGHDVNLTHVDRPEDLPNADKDDAIIVAVDREGHIYIGTNQTQEDQVTATIRDMVKDRIEKTIFIKSDKRAKYDVRSAGVDEVGLLTERVERRGPTTTTPPPGS